MTTGARGCVLKKDTHPWGAGDKNFRRIRGRSPTYTHAHARWDGGDDCDDHSAGCGEACALPSTNVAVMEAGTQVFYYPPGLGELFPSMSSLYCARVCALAATFACPAGKHCAGGSSCANLEANVRQQQRHQ